MNLYRLDFTHYAPRGQREGTVGYFLAEDEKELIEKVDNITYWSSYIGEEWVGDIDDKEVTFEEALIHHKGDEFREMSDYYYGEENFYWELVEENISQEKVDVLKTLNILE